MHEHSHSMRLTVFDLSLIPAISIIDYGELHDYFIMEKPMGGLYKIKLLRDCCCLIYVHIKHAGY